MGDATYGTTCDFLICPYAGHQLPDDKDALNYCQSAHRTCVERAFGGIVARWGVFWKPLRTRRSDRQMTIIRAGVALHNLCVEAVVSSRPPSSRQRRGPRQRWGPRQRTAKDKREALTWRLQLAGVRRPPLPEN
eukprot:COSAG02_NODE_421_length_22605_cov_158.841198_2_plen_134_part_00